MKVQPGLLGFYGAEIVLRQTYPARPWVIKFRKRNQTVRVINVSIVSFSSYPRIGCSDVVLITLFEPPTSSSPACSRRPSS